MNGEKKKTKERKGRPSSPSGAAQGLSESAIGMQQRIAQTAYALWEQRGRQEGDGIRDWLDAEAIVMTEILEARR